jgi:hypothetical protein
VSCQDEDFQVKLAKLVNAIGVELIYGWTAVLRSLSPLLVDVIPHALHPDPSNGGAAEGRSRRRKCVQPVLMFVVNGR